MKNNYTMAIYRGDNKNIWGSYLSPLDVPLPSTKTCVVWDFPNHVIIPWESAYKSRNSVSKTVITDLRVFKFKLARNIIIVSIGKVLYYNEDVKFINYSLYVACNSIVFR